MATLLRLSRSTTHRYAITLTVLGYLEQGDSRKYRLGPRVIDLGMAAVRSTELHGVLRPHLERLRDLTSLTTTLAVLDDTAVLHLDSARSYKTGQGEVARIVASGSRRPLHCTSVGKLLLAHLSTTQQHDLLAKITLHKYGPKTLVNKHTLRKHLDEVSEAAIATADEESADGTCSIAAPICRRGHVVAARAIESRGPMLSLTGEAASATSHLLATAEQIGAAIDRR